MMKNKLAYPRAPVVALGLSLVVCLAASPVGAGVIPFDITDPSVAVSQIVGPGLGDVDVLFVNTDTPNTDADNNVEINTKRFDHAGYIDIEFNVTDSNGITTYRVIESVDNNAGPPPAPIVPWIRYRVELGFDVGDDFVLSTAGDGLSFESPPFPTSGAFAGFSFISEDVLEYSGGVHASGAENYRFSINVPDGITNFTLRQTPIPIPEPATAALVGLAVALAGGFARRRG